MPKRLKKFQLLARLRHLLLLATMVNFYFPELLIRDAHNPYVAILRQKRLHALDVYIRVLATSTMPHIDGELEHCKAVFQNLFPKICVGLTLPFRLGRQIEKHQNPHNPIFTETFGNHFSG